MGIDGGDALGGIKPSFNPQVLLYSHQLFEDRVLSIVG